MGTTRGGDAALGDDVALGDDTVRGNDLHVLMFNEHARELLVYSRAPDHLRSVRDCKDQCCSARSLLVNITT